MLTEERKREILASVGAWPRTPKKPKPTVVAEVSEKVAAAARANPESVRVAARAADDTVVVRGLDALRCWTCWKLTHRAVPLLRGGSMPRPENVASFNLSRATAHRVGQSISMIR
jgi:phenylpyruvate tautomerase PptA (4-oxalocrotonate tautomerase family)